MRAFSATSILPVIDDPENDLATHPGNDSWTRSQFAFASALASIGLIVGVAPPTQLAGSNFAVGGLALVPPATAVAILKYRLYDIDRIIKRTLGKRF